MNKITYPQMGNYHIPVNYLLKNITNLEIIKPPIITNKTLEIGNKYSPDFICTPFKYTLGTFIEGIEKGANLALQLGGGCKYGYYFELQQKIINDLNLECEIINLISKGKANYKEIYFKIKKYLKTNKIKNIYYLWNTIKIVEFMDEIEFLIREKKCYIKNYDVITEYKKMLKKIQENEKMWKIRKTYKKIKNNIKKNVENRDNYIKIGIIGELYTIMEPFANFKIEENLLARNISITRETNATYLLFKKNKKMKKCLKSSKYIRTKMGADASDNVCKAEKYCKEGYDAILHIKSSFCTPEISAMPLIEKVCNDYNVPVLFLSFDTNSNETGLSTRIEALLDLIEMRKKND